MNSAEIKAAARRLGAAGTAAVQPGRSPFGGGPGGYRTGFEV